MKNDVVPGRYSEVWFTPTMMGKHNFTCAEYCGKDHSGMKGILTVDSKEDFDKFMVTGGTMVIVALWAISRPLRRRADPSA